MYKYYIDTFNNSETARWGGGEPTKDKALFFPSMTAVALNQKLLLERWMPPHPPKKANSRMASCLEVDVVLSYLSSAAMKQCLSGNQTPVKHLKIFSKYLVHSVYPNHGDSLSPFTLEKKPKTPKQQNAHDQLA